MPIRASLYRTPICSRERLAQELDSVLTPDGIQASDSYHYRRAIFGRDWEIVALDLLDFYPKLAEQAIVGLATLQGVNSDPLTEEEPGKIHHEHRSLVVGKQHVDEDQERIFYDLCHEFGLQAESGKFTTYFSIDSTPNFVRLVWRYCQRYGHTILDRRFVHADGQERTVRQAVRAAMDWAVRQMESSDLGLMEYHRQNRRGRLLHRTLLDGSTSYLHADGRLANTDAPIAPLEVQAFAVDALLMACDLLPEAGNDQLAAWQYHAKRLRQDTLRRFWQGDYFVMALDRDQAGRPRPITVPSAAQVWLLQTCLFDHIIEQRREQFVSSIVCQFYSEEFLTDVGIRTRALSFHDLCHYYEYQGSNTSWPVLTGALAYGLRVQGLKELAADMEWRLTSGLDASQSMCEFWYVYPDGTVAYFAQSDPAATHWHIGATNLPESTQAWTVSAAIRAVEARHHTLSSPQNRPAWKDQLVAEIDQQLREPHTVYVDTEKGRRLERNFLARHK